MVIFLYRLQPESFGDPPAMKPAAIALAGVLTGFGARLGSGCTSGHGICGLSRLSPRSAVAVVTFMTTGAITSYLARETSLSEYVFEPNDDKTKAEVKEKKRESIYSYLLPAAVATGGCVLLFSKNEWLARLLCRSPAASPSMKSSMLEHSVSLAAAALFGTGLSISGMCNPERVSGFLNFSGEQGFDPTLVGVMAGGVLFNLATFWKMHLLNVSCKCSTQPTPPLSKIIKIGMVAENLVINWRLLLGSAVFGIGWGLGGVCPGPAAVSFGAMMPMAKTFAPAMIIGIGLQDVLLGKGFLPGRIRLK